MVLGSQFGARIVDLGRWGMRRMTPWDVVIAGGEGGHNASADAALAVLSPQTFSFTLDDDLVKVVTVWSDGQSCHVNIRYGHDVVLQEENHAFEIASQAKDSVPRSANSPRLPKDVWPTPTIATPFVVIDALPTGHIGPV